MRVSVLCTLHVHGKGSCSTHVHMCACTVYIVDFYLLACTSFSQLMLSQQLRHMCKRVFDLIVFFNDLASFGPYCVRFWITKKKEEI